MAGFPIEQAVYHRAAGEAPRLRARSPGFADAWLPSVEALLEDFGPRPAGVACPLAVFAQPLEEDYVAIVQVGDQPGEGPPSLVFHVLVVPSAPYRDFLGNPFAIADRFLPPWSALGTLPAGTLPEQPLPRRTIADVRKVLKRIKAGALQEGQDPESTELTVDNAESPALLGGVQVLVDGGKLVFVRPAPDPGLVRGLWTLLPDAARRDLWPATFAFSNALDFDVLVVPHRGIDDFSAYTTEEQAADYPAGQYELSLQTAVESGEGDQRALDHLFTRCSSRETLRLALLMTVCLSIVVLFMNVLQPEAPPARPEAVEWTPEQRERAANAVAVVGSHDPYTGVALIEFGKYRRAERAAAAAAIVASYDPWGAAVQARAAFARFVDIWKPAP
jgi:hypothetical protein